jgi:hypothetical protein
MDEARTCARKRREVAKVVRGEVMVVVMAMVAVMVAVMVVMMAVAVVVEEPKAGARAAAAHLPYSGSPHLASAK